MTIYIFLGPSLALDEAKTLLSAQYLPPVAQGDVYRVTRLKPQAIAIIDGYFEHVPSVWHKEILWAMNQGIHVFGAASLGALRAAELTAFGMVGIGQIYEQFQQGVLEDDDEVAVAHASAEDGYRNFSVAMVDIRQTLQSAYQAGILSAESLKTLQEYAKSLFYPHRDYPSVLAYARQKKLPDHEVLEAWLPQNQVNQKKTDARLLLEYLQTWQQSEVAPKRVRYTFQHTQMWESAIASSGRLDETGFSFQANALLDEMRLQGQPYLDLFEQARIRFLAMMVADYQAISYQDENLQAAIQHFCTERNLLSPADLEHWLLEHKISEAELATLVEEELRIERLNEIFYADILNYIPIYLRSLELYPQLLQRLKDKQLVLASLELTQPTLADTGLTETELYQWYFEAMLKKPIPHNLEDYISQIGLIHPSIFRQLLLKEYCYRRYKDSLGKG
jgi:hypothetical protein